MDAYVAIFRVNFRLLTQYRAQALAGLGTQFFWGILKVMIFKALFATGAVVPMNLSQVITYIWLGQAFFQLLPFRADPEVRALVREGTIAYEMLRPVNVYRVWLARSIAARTAPTVLRAMPMLPVAYLFFDMQGPASATAATLFVISLVSGALVAGALTTFTSVTMLWTTTADGVTQLMSVGAWLFTGLTVPLPFFPATLAKISDVLPFRAILDTPFRIYMGHLCGVAALQAIAHQAAWLGGLVLLGQYLLARGCRRLVINGG